MLRTLEYAKQCCPPESCDLEVRKPIHTCVGAVASVDRGLLPPHRERPSFQCLVEKETSKRGNLPWISDGQLQSSVGKRRPRQDGSWGKAAGKELPMGTHSRKPKEAKAQRKAWVGLCVGTFLLLLCYFVSWITSPEGTCLLVLERLTWSHQSFQLPLCLMWCQTNPASLKSSRNIFLPCLCVWKMGLISWGPEHSAFHFFTGERSAIAC